MNNDDADLRAVFAEQWPHIEKRIHTIGHLLARSDLPADDATATALLILAADQLRLAEGVDRSAYLRLAAFAFTTSEERDRSS